MKNKQTGKFFMPNSAPTVRIARRSAELILTSKSDINRRVNEETDIYPSLDIKTTIYLSNRDLSRGFDEQVNYFSEPVINTLKFQIKISSILHYDF